MDDVDYIANNMRDADVKECEAGGFTSFAALLHSINTSIICKTLITPDTREPGAILGVCPGFSPSWGAIWLLGTDSIKQHRVPFLRRSRQALAELYEESGKEVFYNYTFVENTVHHSWLRWLGFTFLRKVPFHNGNEFYEFVKLKG
jgi:hypothetical protein